MSDLKINATINNIEVYWFPGSMRIERSTSSRGTCQARFRATKASPAVGQEIGVYDRGKRIFGGTIQEITISPIVHRGGSEEWYDILATSWEHRLERRQLPAVAYSKMSAGEIVAAVIASLGEVHVGEIGTGATADQLGTVIYRALNAAQLIDELASRSNYVWYIDPDMYFWFVPRTHDYALSEVSAANLNYRDPQVRVDRSDYFNKVSLAISYEAFSPIVFSIAGNESYPSFDLYDPADENKTPAKVDVIRSITLNGIDQTFGVKVLDDAGEITDPKTLYYTPGEATIEWDADQPAPTASDVVKVEYYNVGANVVTVEDTSEIAAIAAAELNGSGTYHAYLEDMDCKDADAAQVRCEEFLDFHAPGRNDGHATGDWPKEYKWVSDSHKFATEESAWVDDLLPGKIITFAPSTPSGISVEVVIQSVTIEDLRAKNPEVFRYTVTAIDTARSADYLAFYKALAELGPSQSGVRDFPNPVIASRSVIFGIAAPEVTTDVGWYVKINLPEGQVWRPTSAWIAAHTASSSGDVILQADYSDDGGSTWTSIISGVTLASGEIDSDPVANFSTSPEPLDIPAGSLIRCGCTSAGTGAENVYFTMAGEVRKATT